MKVTRLTRLLPAAPRPIFFTHATSKEKYKLIEKGGKILPLTEGVTACSLDGGIGNYSWGDYSFLFPIGELTNKKVEPIFYLGTGDCMETVRVNEDDKSNFLIMDMTCLFATEVQIRGTLDISKARLLHLVPPPPTALVVFLAPILPELKVHWLGGLGYGPEIRTYTPMLLSTVDAYNRMLSDFFNISYDEVKKGASESDAWEDRWWE